MQINTNVSSLFAQRQGAEHQGALSRTLSRLSSGMRINSARDDAAGMAIAERMSTQVRGLGVATRNASDGISLLQTAEGALAAMTDNVQRIRELGLQAANATLSLDDRRALQSEVNQLLQELGRIARDTDFNGQQVFDTTGTGGLESDPDKRAVVDGLRDRWLKASEDRILEYYGLQGDGASLEVVLEDTPDPSYLAAVSGTVDPGSGRIVNQQLRIDMSDFVPLDSDDGGTAPYFNDRIIAHEMVHAVMGRSTSMAALPTWFIEGTAEFIHGADERVTSDLAAAVADAGGDAAAGANALVAELDNPGWGGTSAEYSAGYVATRYLHQAIKDAGGEGIRDVMNYLSENIGSDLDDALANVATADQYSTAADFLTEFTAADGAGSLYLQNLSDSGQLANDDTGAIGGADADGGAVLTRRTVIDDSSRYSDDPLAGFAEVWPDGHDVQFAGGGGGSWGFHVGTERDQTIDVSRMRVSVEALGLAGIDLTESTGKVIVRADAALDYINGARAELGAAQARMESAIASNEVARENLSAARSRIRDADIAVETAELTRTTILQQAATAMLAQANQSPRDVLQLLQ